MLSHQAKCIANEGLTDNRNECQQVRQLWLGLIKPPKKSQRMCALVKLCWKKVFRQI